MPRIHLISPLTLSSCSTETLYPSKMVNATDKFSKCCAQLRMKTKRIRRKRWKPVQDRSGTDHGTSHSQEAPKVSLSSSAGTCVSNAILLYEVWKRHKYSGAQHRWSGASPQWCCLYLPSQHETVHSFISPSRAVTNSRTLCRCYGSNFSAWEVLPWSLQSASNIRNNYRENLGNVLSPTAVWWNEGCRH